MTDNTYYEAIQRLLKIIENQGVMIDKVQKIDKNHHEIAEAKIKALKERVDNLFFIVIIMFIILLIQNLMK